MKKKRKKQRDVEEKISQHYEYQFLELFGDWTLKGFSISIQ